MTIQTGSNTYSNFVYDDNDDGEVLLVLGWKQKHYERVQRVAAVLRTRMPEYNAAREADGLFGAREFVAELNG